MILVVSVRQTLAPAVCWILGLALLCSQSLQAQGFSGSGTMQIAWPSKGEILSYQSCGCADSCWQAELQERHSRILKARLRCDCETLFYYQPTAEPQRRVIGSCDVINNSDDKQAAIRRQIELLLHPSGK